MNFLKSFGLVLAKVIGAVSGITPIVASLLPEAQKVTTTKFLDKFDQAAQQILTVEAAFTAAYGEAKTGAQKLQAGQALIAPIIQGLDVLAGKKLINQTLYVDGIKDITNGIAKVLNAHEA